MSEKQEALNHTLWPIFSKMKKDGEMRPREGRILPAVQISVWIRRMVIEITRNVRLLSGERLLDGHGLSGDQSWRWKFDEKQIVPSASCYFDHRCSKKFLPWLTSTWYLLYRKGYQIFVLLWIKKFLPLRFSVVRGGKKNYFKWCCNIISRI